METRSFHLSDPERQSLRTRIRDRLSGRSDLAFAYLHGSFVTEDSFRDVDVAFYLKGIPASPLSLELELETELSEAIGGSYPLDARALNVAPLSFRYRVLRGGVPFLVVDEESRIDFVEATLRTYFDFSPFHKRYLREAFGRAV